MKKIFKFIHKIFEKSINEKSKKSVLYANEYLEKFDYQYIPTLNETSPKQKSNYIWQMWYQGEENAPLIVKKCLESVKKYNPDKEIIVINEKSIDKYIEVPFFVREKYKKGIISKAHFSDYIRTCLLVKYGGIWIDSTVLLTDKIPDEILNQNFFVFKNPLWYNLKTVPTENLFSLFLLVDKNSGLYGSNWFILSKPNNIILQLQKRLLEQYWYTENSLIQYYMYHFFLSKIIIKRTECKKIFEKMYSLSNKEPHILQNLLHDKYNEELFGEIKRISPIHKLTYKFNKVIPGSFLEEILKSYL